jgi:hypothetical protein
MCVYCSPIERETVWGISLPTLLPIPAILRIPQHTHLNPKAKSPKLWERIYDTKKCRRLLEAVGEGGDESLPREPIHVNFCRFLHPLPNPLPHSHLASQLFFNSNLNTTVTHLASHLHVPANSVAISLGHVRPSSKSVVILHWKEVMSSTPSLKCRHLAHPTHSQNVKCAIHLSTMF